ncbi:MAG: hypothetical protein ACK5X0_14560 [Rhodospirillales bacterium]|jgi:hypothetical protein
MQQKQIDQFAPGSFSKFLFVDDQADAYRFELERIVEAWDDADRTGDSVNFGGRLKPLVAEKIDAARELLRIRDSEKHNPKNITITMFRQSGRHVENIGHASGNILNDRNSGRMYLGCLYIYSSSGAADDSRWELMFDDVAIRSGNLGKLEADLYKFATQVGALQLTHEELYSLYLYFCDQNGLGPLDPDENLKNPCLTEEQIAFLIDYMKVWAAVSEEPHTS